MHHSEMASNIYGKIFMLHIMNRNLHSIRRKSLVVYNMIRAKNVTDFRPQNFLENESW